MIMIAFLPHFTLVSGLTCLWDIKAFESSFSICVVNSEKVSRHFSDPLVVILGNRTF